MIRRGSASRWQIRFTSISSALVARSPGGVILRLHQSPLCQFVRRNAATYRGGRISYSEHHRGT